MYRIDIHIKQNSKIREKHWSYNAIDIRIFENAVYILLSNNRVKAFNMNEVSSLKVHKLEVLK